MKRTDRLSGAIGELALHIRAVHFVLVAACFALAALVVTAEPGSQFLQAQADVEGIRRATKLGVPHDPAPSGLGINLVAKEFSDTPIRDEIGLGDPFALDDCVIIELSDDYLLAPHLARQDSRAYPYELGLISLPSRQELYLLDTPFSRPEITPKQLTQNQESIADWFRYWNDVRDPVPVLWLLPQSLSWFRREELPRELQEQLSRVFKSGMGERPREGALDLIQFLESQRTLPTKSAWPTGTDRCQSILSSSFELLQLKQTAKDIWRAVFVLPVRADSGPDSDFALDGIAVFDADLRRVDFTTGWQGQIAARASASWRPGTAAESFTELEELTRGLDSMVTMEVGRLIDNLERQTAASQANVSVATMDLPGHLAASWGIGIVIAIQVYLCLQILRLKDLLTVPQSPLAIWIGLYPGIFPRVATVVSICIPPFACIAAIVTASIRDGLPEGWFAQVGLFLLPFAGLALGVITAAAVSDLANERE